MKQNHNISHLDKSDYCVRCFNGSKDTKMKANHKQFNLEYNNVLAVSMVQDTKSEANHNNYVLDKH